jgi:hypothetical protein
MPLWDGLVKALFSGGSRMGPAEDDLDRRKQVARPAAIPAVLAHRRRAGPAGEQPDDWIMPGHPDRHTQIEERRTAADEQLAMPRIDDL